MILATCEHKNRRTNGTTKAGATRFRCKDCGKSWTESTDTLGGMRIGLDKATQVVELLCEGMSVMATLPPGFILGERNYFPDFAHDVQRFVTTDGPEPHPDLELWEPETLGELEDGIRTMIDTPGPVIVDCRVAKLANCFPMIPSGAAHTDMILQPNDIVGTMDDEAKALV